jgi:hypothetical protein
VRCGVESHLLCRPSLREGVCEQMMRFTVRRMMFAVAIIPVALGSAVEADRVCRFREDCFLMANAHETHEAVNREYTRFFLGHTEYAQRVADSVTEYERLLLNLARPQIPSQEDELHAWRRADIRERSMEEVLETRENAFRAARLASYHAALKKKYRRAANRPWSSVEPDEPEPERPTSGPSVWSIDRDGRPFAYYEGQTLYGYGSVQELNGLAWFLATCPDAKRRDGRRAIALAGLACELTRRKAPSYLVTLAAAFAECGEFGRAAQTQREAVELLSGRDPRAEEYRARVEHYEAKRPFRNVSKMGKAPGS